jgi:hypothetical protein
VKEQILSNSSSLALRDNAYFLSRTDVIAIFGTNSGYLTKMLKEAKESDKTALILDKDYVGDPDKGYAFALSGVIKLAVVFAKNITRRNRKDWCADVGGVIEPCFYDILKLIKERDERIVKAVKHAKTREKKTCQVTGVTSNRVNKIPLAGHHLYSRAEYPHLVDSLDNIVCITCEVHDHFHEFMGGAKVACTLDDFERYVREYHPGSSVFFWLQQQKLKLGNQQPITAKERTALHLPWPIPKLLPPAKR